jgi:hypothetical protein
MPDTLLIAEVRAPARFAFMAALLRLRQIVVGTSTPRIRAKNVNCAQRFSCVANGLAAAARRLAAPTDQLPKPAMARIAMDSSHEVKLENMSTFESS